MNDIAAAYDVVMVDAEKEMADRDVVDNVADVWWKYGIDVISTGGW